MKFRWAILAFLFTVLVGSAWVYRARTSTPILVSIDALRSATTAGKPSGRVAVIGTVQPSSRHDQAAEWWFTLERDGRVLPVHYTGPVPSTFFDDPAQVMVVGTMRDGTFHAGSLAVRVRM